VLGKNPSAEEVKEWRESHGIPEAPDKYDLGKDVKIEESTSPVRRDLQGLHAANADARAGEGHGEDLVRCKNDALAGHESRTGQWKQKRRGHAAHRVGRRVPPQREPDPRPAGFAGSQELKDSPSWMRACPTARRSAHARGHEDAAGGGADPEPHGTVVPGGTGVTGEGIKQELDKLQKIPTAKKTESSRRASAT
jgi:hypothetical protein